jgi:hypothetical protein
MANQDCYCHCSLPWRCDRKTPVPKILWQG